jgi:hypothetical protein
VAEENIIEICRREAQTWIDVGIGDGWPLTQAADLIEAQQAEIERLRAERDDLQVLLRGRTAEFQAEIERLRDRSCSTCVHGRKRPAEAYEPDCYSCAGVLKGNSFAMPFYCFSYEEARRA